jgi:hypothetical protein
MTTTASDISRICKDKITFYEGVTDFSTIVDDDILVDFVPSWDTVNSVANTPIVTFTTPNSGAGSPDVVLRGVHNPEVGNDAATKAYVDSIAVVGVSWKNTVRAATTGIISPFPPTTGGTTIDTVSVVVGDRVLVKDQGDANNGIYIVKANTESWVRSDDVPNLSNAAGFAVWVDSGEANGDKGFVVTNDAGNDEVGSATLEWANFSSSHGVAGNNGDIQINDNNGHSSVTDGTLKWDTTAGTLIVVGGSGDGEAMDVSGGYASFHGGAIFATAGNLHLEDSIQLRVGTGADFTIVHDGIDNLLTSATGDMIISNTNATGDSIMRLGDAAGVTNFKFQDSAVADLWSLNSDGAVTHTLGSYTLLDSIPLNVGTGSDLVISHDGTDSSVVNSTGILKIQQSAAGSDLHIENTSTTAGDGIDFKLAANTTGTSFNFIGDSAGTPTTLMQVMATSEDSTSFTTGTVRITGGLAVTQDVTAVCVNMLSDATTKTNISPLSDPLSKIKQIEGFNYNFLPGYGSSNRMNTGVLAQQIETIPGLEHCVTTDPRTGYKSVNYTFLIPMMIEGMKSLSENVDRLSYQLETLKK